MSIFSSLSLNREQLYNLQLRHPLAILAVVGILSAPAHGQVSGQITQTDTNVLAPHDTAIGNYITFQAKRQWRLLNLRNSLTRQLPRPVPAGVLAEPGFSSSRTTGTKEENAEEADNALLIRPAAAMLGNGWTLWTSADLSRLRDVRTGRRKRGQATGITAGLENAVNESLTFGASIGYVHTNQDTLFNNGNSRINGLTITPYLSLTLTEWLNITFSGGYVYNHERLRWVSGGVLARGSRHSNGYTASVILEASRWYDSFLLSARTGIVASRDSWKAFTDSLGARQPAMRETVVQWNAELNASLWLDPVMPYLTVTYTYDLKKATSETDRDDFTLTGGFSWHGSDALEGLAFDLSGSVILGRRSQRNYTISAGLRISF
jgi:hypothetical protein